MRAPQSTAEQRMSADLKIFYQVVTGGDDRVKKLTEPKERPSAKSLAKKFTTSVTEALVGSISLAIH